ncbi:probable carboxylesterase 17 [Salvia hispanica]|uniref:probable carboxylesterase 17 n=1 Tax=Salvia hispanica TaxID=49212 RepID=UPI0020099339|nr:probable carboxylesterase 17 [Salvia hispanica]
MALVHERKMIDQVSGWLTLFDDGSADRTWAGPPEVKFMTDAVPPHANFIDGVAVTDVTPSDCPKLRIYTPERRETDPEKLPVLLHFHGGGFCISEPDWYMYYAVYTRLARDARAIVVSPYLRLAPEHRLPAAFDDGAAALRWAGGGGGGADSGRIFLIGDSSGGNIVHQVAVRAAAEGVPVAGAIPVHPGFCRSGRSRSEIENPETPFLTLDMMDKFLALALPEGATKDHPYTCPMGTALPELPPYLYCVAEEDLMWDTEMEFYEEMKREGKEVELFVSKGVGHSFYLNKIAVEMDPTTAARTEELFRRIKEFVDKHSVSV